MENIYLNGEFFNVLETQSLKMRKNLSGFFGGKNLTKSYGQTVEFSDYREYALGDDIRCIDWNLYSRFEKHYLKLFTDEKQMQVDIYIDCSASMSGEKGAKGQYAMALAAGLGYLAVNNMDKVSFKFVKEDGVDESLGVTVGKKKFFSKLPYLNNMIFEGDAYLSDAILKKVSNGKKSNMLILISDFLTYNDWQKAVDYLVHKGHQVLLVQVLSKEERYPNYTGRMNLIDTEAQDLLDDKNIRLKINGNDIVAYEKAWQELHDKLGNYCKKRGAGFISVSTDMDISRVIFRELMKVGVLA